MGNWQVVVLENARVRAVVIPALGGRIWELTDKTCGRQWIWHREDVALASSPVGSSYDDVWAGGWEELFPNDAPGSFEGRELPDHGEWWALPWTIDESSSGSDAKVRLVTQTNIRRTSCTKEFCLPADGATLRATYRIESRETDAFHFLFKQHFPVAITPACELRLPGGSVTAVDPAFGTVLANAGPLDWPAAGPSGDDADLTRVPHRSASSREFVYVRALPDGWCGVDDLERGASLRMHFDTRHMPFVWLFLTYGGWRDCYTAVLEPCTNMPKDLSEAARRGQSAHLPAGGRFETTVAVSLGGVDRSI